MLWKLTRESLTPYKWQFFLAIGLQLIQVLAALYLPTLNADIIDNGVVKGDTAYIWRIGAFMLAFSLIQLSATILALYFSAKISMSAGRDLRRQVFRHIHTLSTKEVGTFGASSLITRNTNDVQQVQMLILMTMQFMISSPIMMLGGVIVAVQKDLVLSGLLLVIVPIMGISAGLIISKATPGFRRMQKQIDRVTKVMREQIIGVRVIRAFVKDYLQQSKFKEANRDLFETSLFVTKLMALLFPLVGLIMNLSSVAVIWFGAMRINAGQMQIGALTAFISYLMIILISVMTSTMMFVMIPRAQVSAERIKELLNTETSVTPGQGAASANKTEETNTETNAEVTFSGVSFHYPGAQKPVLQDLSFTATPGATTAIIGSTGSGKTTVMRLIPRLYDPTSGSILLGGQDLRSLSEAELSRRVGYIPQKAFLFSGTIRSNLQYGLPDATDTQIWQALEMAQAAGFVRDLAAGLDAKVEQGGSNFSGGQRQRLAIARALIGQRSVYLFDDSFSALDYATDAALRQAITPLKEHAVVLIVAQRVSTIQHAEHIVVLDEGRIVGQGTHEQLLTSCKTYQEIVASQLSSQESQEA